MDVVPGKAGSRVARSRKPTERASNAPQGMKARKIEARILEMMPHGTWMTCTAVSRLIGSGDDRKTRARLDRLVGDGKLERKREQGIHGMVYLFRSILQKLVAAFATNICRRRNFDDPDEWRRPERREGWLGTVRRAGSLTAVRNPDK